MSASNLDAGWQLPLRWPQPAAATRERSFSPVAERLLKAAIVFALLALTVLDRFGLRVTAEWSIPPGAVAMYLLAATMVATGTGGLHWRGALAYVALVGVAASSLWVNLLFAPPAYVSAASFFLLVVLYAPFAFALRRAAVSPALWQWTARLYVAFSLFLALAGIAQFFAQFVLFEPWLFDYTPLIRDSLRASGGWNTVYYVGSWVKSNGFFLREPSIFSLAMAFAILCELGLAARKWVLAVLGLGLVLSYSGSGLVCLAAALLLSLRPRALLRILGTAAAVGVALVVFWDTLNLSYTVNRVEEIQSQKSSAYCRLVYPGAVALQEIDSSAWAAVLGHGPGTMQRMGGTCIGGHQTAYAKALIEYGLAGVIAVGALILGALGRSGLPLRFRAPVALAWLLLGGNLLASEVSLFLYLLSGMWFENAARAAAPEDAA